MENRARLFLLGQAFVVSMLCLSWQSPSFAQDSNEPDAIIKPSINPEPLKPAKIDTENFEVGVYIGIYSVEDFGTNKVTGARLAYHVTEDVFLEAAYGKTTTEETSYERLSGAVQLLTEEQRQLEYYNISLGFNILPGEAFIGKNYAFHTALYLIGGTGKTKFAGDDRRTINFGFGYRAILSDWLALHFDARDHIFDIDLLGTQKTNNNLELTTGLTVFF